MQVTCTQDPVDAEEAGIILCMRPANERRRYNVTSSLIGWAHAQNKPRVGSVGCVELLWLSLLSNTINVSPDTCASF